MIKKLYIEKFRLFQNQEFHFGNVITAISGQNAVGKSTILGLVGNIIEDKTQNIFGKPYRTDFSEIFKASTINDKTGEHKGVFFLNQDNYEVHFRSTWQSGGTRFRIIPNRKDDNGNKTESKFPLPVIYLGLSRLYPIGETQNNLLEDQLNLNQLEKKWFKEVYTNVLTMSEEVEEVHSLKTTEVKSNFTGISTSIYDAFCNSAGQDNLGQILLSLISFIRLKENNVNWKGGVFIIDELDATLHPVAQQKLVDLLYKEAKKIGIQVIFTTHSLNVLEYISSKYEGKKTFGEDYKIIFISKANEVVKIYHNPKYEHIKNDLCLTITQEIKKNKQLLVFSEDDTTRWFFKKLIHGYSTRLKLITANLGCTDLEKLLKDDPSYFSKALIVVDGDVKNTLPRFVRRENVIALPGTKRPEEILFDYINSVDCTFWTESLAEKGMTRKYFITEKGPFSHMYNDKQKKRQKFSNWFYDQKEAIEKYKMFEHWKKNNPEEFGNFRTLFFRKFNQLAEINELPLIDPIK